MRILPQMDIHDIGYRRCLIAGPEGEQSLVKQTPVMPYNSWPYQDSCGLRRVNIALPCRECGMNVCWLLSAPP
jgi:hypothetical protein